MQGQESSSSLCSKAAGQKGLECPSQSLGWGRVEEGWSVYHQVGAVENIKAEERQNQIRVQ